MDTSKNPTVFALQNSKKKQSLIVKASVIHESYYESECVSEWVHSCLSGWRPGYLNSCVTHRTAVSLAKRLIDYPSSWLAACLLNSCVAAWSSCLTGYVNDSEDRGINYWVNYLNHFSIWWIRSLLFSYMCAYNERDCVNILPVCEWLDLCVASSCSRRGPVARCGYTIHIV